MRDYQTKSNVGALPDTITATRFGSGEFNSIAVELENAVSTSGQTLAAADGTGEVSTQLAMALAIYGAGGATYHIDTGAVNAYVLTPVSPKESPNAYFNGFSLVFEPGTVNTTASTVNVGGLGVKSITLQNGTALTGGEISGTCCLKYNLSDDRFELIYSSNSFLSISNYYEIDATQADQGATSTNSETYTIYDVATLVGTSKFATIHLSHNPAAGNQTLYTFDTSLDLSTYPNLFFSIDPGAQFDRTTGDEVLTLYSPSNLVISKGQQITSVDILSFSNDEYASVNWWGTDGNAIQFALNSGARLEFIGGGVYTSAQQITLDGQSIYIKGNNASIVFTNNASAGFSFTLDASGVPAQDYVEMRDLKIIADGTLTDPAISMIWDSWVSNAESGYNLINISILPETFGTDQFSQGIYIENGFNGEIVSLQIIGDSGLSMNGVQFNDCISCKLPEIDIAYVNEAITFTRTSHNLEGFIFDGGFIYNVINGLSSDGTIIDLRFAKMHISATESISQYAISLTDSAQSSISDCVLYVGNGSGQNVINLVSCNSITVTGNKIIELGGGGAVTGVNSIGSIYDIIANNVFSSLLVGINFTTASDDDNIAAANMFFSCTTEIADSGSNNVSANQIDSGNQVVLSNVASGSSPTLACTGNDTNLDLKLAPKGTGILQIMYSLPAASTPANFSADYILYVKDSAGTSYYIPAMLATW